MAHKPTIARGEKTVPDDLVQDGNIPALPLRIVTVLRQVPTDPLSIKFRIIQDPDTTPLQVFPSPTGDKTVNAAEFFPTGDKLSTGRFVASGWTVPHTAFLGEHEIIWTVQFDATDTPQEYKFRFTVVDAVVADSEHGAIPTSTGDYCTIKDVRDEGFSDSSRFKDPRIATLITGASRDIERWTGRFFEPRLQSHNLDGSGAETQELPMPIIEIREVRILNDRTDTSPSTAIDMEDITVFNRHLTQRMVGEDDREDPRISLVPSSGTVSSRAGVFPRGLQNVKVTGIFGYTDAAPATHRWGVTPEKIRQLCVKLVIRELIPMMEWEEREDYQKRHLLSAEKADDQSFSYRPHGRAANITGDPEIDGIIVDFSAPPDFQAVGGVAEGTGRNRLDELSIDPAGLGAC